MYVRAHRLAVFQLVVLSVLVGVLAAASTARAVPLLDVFGGPVGYGPNNLAANDDGSSAAIDLTSAFPGGVSFFGGPYTQFWVNNNGNITFNDALYDFTPASFPIASQPMIAPYWGDVDTRGGGAPNNNGVFWALEPGRLEVAWHNVGYYSSHDDKKMDFQMILTNALGCGLGDFDVEFRYNRCEWTTGDASGGSGGLGGTPAQAGFDAGNLTDYVAIPGSLTMAILDLCTTSNVGEPGIWRFSVRGGMVSCPGTGEPCDTGAVGRCGIGLTQCVGGGVSCIPAGMATDEICNNIDDNCDGTVDEGDLCPNLEVCSNGACVPPCFEGGCATGYSCIPETGGCVETACIGVTCPTNTRCAHGECVGACEGIVCPHGQQCFAGRCADRCEILTCDAGEICFDGECRPQCPCYPCPDGWTCLADGSCEDPGCSLTICDAGYYCDEGSCLDACVGAVCPAGQHCEVGNCVDGDDTPDAGVPDAGTLGDGGVGTGDGGSNPRGGGGRRGCGCDVPSSGPVEPWALASLLVLGLAVFGRRGRRR